MYADKEEIAKKQWQKLIKIPVLTADCLSEWLIATDFLFGAAKVGFGYDVDFYHKVVIDENIKYDFTELFYIHNIAQICSQHSNIIPHFNPLIYPDGGA